MRLTSIVATMYCAYAFAVLALLGFPGKHASKASYVAWISQTFIQLTMLSVIMVGQRLMADMHRAHHAEVKELHRQLHVHLGIKEATVKPRKKKNC